MSPEKGCSAVEGLLGAAGQTSTRRSEVTQIHKEDKRVPTGTRSVNVHCCNRRAGLLQGAKLITGD